MRYLRRKRRTALYELLCREYGVPCPAWTSMQAFRYTAFGPRRRWVKILHTRHSSLLELSGDLLWLTVADQSDASHHYVMKRILGNGRLMTMYSSNISPRLKELEIYEIPDPVYRSSIPQKEYQPVVVGLRKGGVLTRHNLDTGEVYNRINLGSTPTNSLGVNYVADVLVVKSHKLSNPGSCEHFFRFHVFQMHPFKHLTTLDIESSVFPNKEHRERFGKLRNAEIHDGLLLVMTEKSYNLIYDADVIIQRCVARQEKIDEMLELPTVNVVSTAPTLLFHTYAHLDILGLGACPWTYIRAVSDAVLEVRDMGSGETLGNGCVSWCDGGDVIAPDFLMFHTDDSSRLIHVRTQELRVLGIHNRDGKRALEEEFIYPEKSTSSDNVDEVTYSRSGRRTKPMFKLDNTLNRALSFNVETDMRVLVILEAWRDEQRFDATRLDKLMFYDSLSYELLHQMKIGIVVEGSIETNRLSVSIDRDIVNIVSHKGTKHTVLVFRLKEEFSTEEEDNNDTEQSNKLQRNSLRSNINRNIEKRCRRLHTRNSDKDWEDDEDVESRAASRKRRKRGNNNRQVKKRRKRSKRMSSVSESEETDEWTP